jgi:hypothetical protein
MDYLMQADIHRVVAKTLSDLGKPHARLSCLNLRALIRDGYCTGHAIEYEDIRIVLLTDGSLIEFYAADGTLLKTVAADQGWSGRKNAA